MKVNVFYYLYLLIFIFSCSSSLENVETEVMSKRYENIKKSLEPILKLYGGVATHKIKQNVKSKDTLNTLVVNFIGQNDGLLFKHDSASLISSNILLHIYQKFSFKERSLYKGISINITKNEKIYSYYEKTSSAKRAIHVLPIVNKVIDSFKDNDVNSIYELFTDTLQNSISVNMLENIIKPDPFVHYYYRGFTFIPDLNAIEINGVVVYSNNQIYTLNLAIIENTKEKKPIVDLSFEALD